MTATTTREAIRENMVTLIEALAPTTSSDVPFRVERGERDFRTWAEANEAAALRRFSVRFVGQPSPPVISDTLTELVEQDAVEVLIAYPKQYGKYGQGNNRALDDVLDEDVQQIDGQSGVSHNNSGDWVSGQHNCLRIEATVEDDPDAKVVIARLLYSIDYYRSTAT